MPALAAQPAAAQHVLHLGSFSKIGAPGLRPGWARLPRELRTAVAVGSTWSRPDGGMFTWVRLPGDVDTAGLLPAALRHGVAFVPGEAFHAGEPDRSTLRLSFTTHSPDRTAEGVSRLGRTLQA